MLKATSGTVCLSPQPIEAAVTALFSLHLSGDLLAGTGIWHLLEHVAEGLWQQKCPSPR